MNLILQKLLAFGCWEGHKYDNDYNCRSKEQPWFQVKRCNKIINKGKVACQIKVGCQNLCIETISTSKVFAFRIVNKDGQIIAEVI